MDLHGIKTYHHRRRMAKKMLEEYLERYAGDEYVFRYSHQVTIVLRKLGKTKRMICDKSMAINACSIGKYFYSNCEVVDIINNHDCVIFDDGKKTDIFIYTPYHPYHTYITIYKGDIIGPDQYVLCEENLKDYLEYIKTKY